MQWDAFTATNESNRELTNRLTRQRCPLGIIVDTEGKRFLDEGADFRNHTYAKYGKEILQQPGSVAHQVFDATLRPMLRTEECDMPGISVETADTVEELATRIGIDPAALKRTVEDYNASVDRTIEFDPTIKDGRRADTAPPKSNWASPLETGPFYAYGVTCGITFTFGGVRADTHGRVLDAEGRHIEDLYAAGEMLGGLFSTNYPGGSGLAAGCVFGRRAGALAQGWCPPGHRRSPTRQGPGRGLRPRRRPPPHGDRPQAPPPAVPPDRPRTITGRARMLPLTPGRSPGGSGGGHGVPPGGLRVGTVPPAVPGVPPCAPARPCPVPTTPGPPSPPAPAVRCR